MAVDEGVAARLLRSSAVGVNFIWGQIPARRPHSHVGPIPCFWDEELSCLWKIPSLFKMGVLQTRVGLEKKGRDGAPRCQRRENMDGGRRREKQTRLSISARTGGRDREGTAAKRKAHFSLALPPLKFLTSLSSGGGLDSIEVHDLEYFSPSIVSSSPDTN